MNKKAFEDGWRGFLELCAKIENPEAFQNLFALFLTFEERENIASRYLIVKTLLEEQMTQREMSDKYQVSIAQITRGSNALKLITPELKKKLLKLIKRL